jgi:flagellar basal-body rod protein FlgB
MESYPVGGHDLEKHLWKLAHALQNAGHMIAPIFQSDNYQLARKLLDAAVLRQDAIATNIANAETPGYRRLDVSADFASRLKEQLASGDLKRGTTDVRPTLAEDSTARSVRPDGNTVAMERELMALNRNAVEHEFLSEIVSGNIKQLRLAITGRQ